MSYIITTSEEKTMKPQRRPATGAAYETHTAKGTTASLRRSRRRRRGTLLLASLVLFSHISAEAEEPGRSQAAVSNAHPTSSHPASAHAVADKQSSLKEKYLLLRDEFVLDRKTEITVDEIGACIDRGKRVSTLILDPRDEGKSKQDALKMISQSQLSAREKRILSSTAEAAFDYQLDEVGVTVWSIFNCTASAHSDVDFPLPIEKYGRTIEVCGAMGAVARLATEDRNKGKNLNQFVAAHQNHFADSASDLEKGIWTMGAQHGFRSAPSSDPAEVRITTFKTCFRDIYSNNQ